MGRQKNCAVPADDLAVGVIAVSFDLDDARVVAAKGPEELQDIAESCLGLRIDEALASVGGDFVVLDCDVAAIQLGAGEGERLTVQLLADPTTTAGLRATSR